MTQFRKSLLISTAVIGTVGGAVAAVAVPLSNTAASPTITVSDTVVQSPSAINYFGISSNSEVSIAPFTFVQQFNGLTSIQEKLSQLFTSGNGVAQPLDSQVTQISELTAVNTRNIIARTNGSRAVSFTVTLNNGFVFDDGSTTKIFNSDIRGVAGIRTPGAEDFANGTGGLGLIFRRNVSLPTRANRTANGVAATATPTATQIRNAINAINRLNTQEELDEALANVAEHENEGNIREGVSAGQRIALSRAKLLFRLFDNVTQPVLNEDGTPATSAGFLNWNSAWFINDVTVEGETLQVEFEAAPTWVFFQPTNAEEDVRLLSLTVASELATEEVEMEEMTEMAA